MAGEFDCEIVVFGSRATKKYSRGSDMDLGIRGLCKANFYHLKGMLEDWMEESIIPFRVDLVNLDIVSDKFALEVLRHGKKWKKSSSIN